ncbi:MAG: class I SAM-dependent methyltransferase [Minisyncoccia bacterium]
MKEISFVELPLYIPERFEQLENDKQRTHAAVYREYNDEKYAQLANAASFEEAVKLYRGPVRDTVFSRHNKFYRAPSNEAHALREALVISSLYPLLDGVDTIIELGAGFGQTLEVIRRAYPSLRYIAGEPSPEARALGERVAPDISFVPFDFYDETWHIFDGVQNALVFSSYAVSLLPDAQMVADKLKAYAPQIRAVSLFEPIYEDGDSPIFEARKRYIEANDYCRTILQSFDAEVERDFFGTNPLFPEANLVLKKGLG